MSAKIDIGVAQLVTQLGAILKAAADTKKSVVVRTLGYLKAVQVSAEGLRRERERILSAARRCEISKKKKAQVAQVLDRLRVYLDEYKVQPKLRIALDGLTECRGNIEKQLGWIEFRKRDKEAALADFDGLISEIRGLFDGLMNSFYPGGSGMGIRTLIPLKDLLKELKGKLDKHEVFTSELQESYDERRHELLDAALRDESHIKWIETSGKIEALAERLRWTFRV